jgi:hypothetical protein
MRISKKALKEIKAEALRLKQIYEAQNLEVDKIILELREEAKGKPENMSKDEEIAYILGNTDDRHCSYCIHYEACPSCQMYCKALQRRITARKSAKNCKYYKSFIKEVKK